VTTGYGIFVEHGIGAVRTSLHHLDSLPDWIDTFVETVDMELLLLLVFGSVNVDVSSGLLRSDNTSVLKGNTIYCRHGTGSETGLPRKGIWYRVFFSRIEGCYSVDCNAARI
jgi:hypothetical protein